MRVKALKDFSSTVYGNVSAGQVLPAVPESLAAQWNAIGLTAAVEYDTKVVPQAPTVPAKPKRQRKGKA